MVPTATEVLDRNVLVIHPGPAAREALGRLCAHESLPCTTASSLDALAIASLAPQVVVAAHQSVEAMSRLHAVWPCASVVPFGTERDAIVSGPHLVGLIRMLRSGVDVATALRRVQRPILVADDDPELRDAIRELLETMGEAVLVVNNGRELQEHLESGLEPRAIMLDLFMPVMGGSEFLLWQRRQTPGIARVPVVVTSGHRLDHREPLLRAPVVKVLPKPFGVDELVLALRSCHEK